MLEITKTQMKYLRSISGYIAKNECPPTIVELADEFGVACNSSRQHLIELEKKGMITRSNNARSIRITDSGHALLKDRKNA